MLYGDRRRLPDRRYSETFRIDAVGQHFFVTVGFFEDIDRVAEFFVNSAQKAGTEAEINLSDASVAASLALQYGCPIEVLCGGMKRNQDGSAQGPLGAVLDRIIELHGNQDNDPTSTPEPPGGNGPDLAGGSVAEVEAVNA